VITVPSLNLTIVVLDVVPSKYLVVDVVVVLPESESVLLVVIEPSGLTTIPSPDVVGSD
jgi:hypothetical protein